MQALPTGTVRKGTPGDPLPVELRDALASMVRRLGENATLSRLGIGRPTLGRALGGLGLRRGTVAMIRAALQQSPEASAVQS